MNSQMPSGEVTTRLPVSPPSFTLCRQQPLAASRGSSRAQLPFPQRFHCSSPKAWRVRAWCQHTLRAPGARWSQVLIPARGQPGYKLILCRPAVHYWSCSMQLHFLGLVWESRGESLQEQEEGGFQHRCIPGVCRWFPSKTCWQHMHHLLHITQLGDGFFPSQSPFPPS